MVYKIRMHDNSFLSVEGRLFEVQGFRFGIGPDPLSPKVVIATELSTGCSFFRAKNEKDIEGMVTSRVAELPFLQEQIKVFLRDHEVANAS